MRRFETLRAGVAALLLVACGGDGYGYDGSVVDAVPPGICLSDDECSDDRYCNGEERCDPDAPGADRRGCLVGDTPCVGQRCDEENRACSACENADADGDGHDDVACGGDDCDDSDPARFPGNIEICDDLDRDEDCDPDTVGPDADGDGFSPASCCNATDGALRCGADCDDTNAELNPFATEVCNGQDEDCDGTLDEGVPHTIFPDDDGDGFGRSRDGVSACALPDEGGYSFNAGDCDDTDASLNPANREECNDIDDDCDGAIDEGCPCEPGQDRPCGEREPDGSYVEVGVCHAGDQICRERRWSSCIMAELPTVERCNRVDDDCDGIIDEGQAQIYYLDIDGDGAGSPDEARSSCGVIAGYVLDGGDCDDANPNVGPSATEICNLIDDDCDGTTDEGLSACGGECIPDDVQACETDCGVGERLCVDGVWTMCSAPAPMMETCNERDDDCDTRVDEDLSCGECTEGATRACETDCGTGVETCEGGSFQGCNAPAPEAESCNGMDDDCDENVDEGVMPLACSTECGGGFEICTMGSFAVCDAQAPISCFDDTDGDGYGPDGVEAMPLCPTDDGSCPEMFAAVAGDCLPDNPDAYPGATEVCNAVNDDCDLATDEAVGGGVLTRACTSECGEGTETCMDGGYGGCDAPTSIFCLPDTDGDGYGPFETPGSPVCPASDGSCPDMYADFGGDCLPDNPDAYPGAMEVCNGVNDDCDGGTDEGTTIGCYADADADGYGTGELVQVCGGDDGSCPTMYAAAAGDCLPDNPDAYPGATEVCNDVNDDCDLATDEGTGGAPLTRDCIGECGSGTETCRGGTYGGCTAPGTVLCYPDADMDMFGLEGSPASPICPVPGGTDCPPGTAAVEGDCDDMRPLVNPDAAEVCNNVNDDCDLGVDEDAMGQPLTQSCATACGVGIETCRVGVYEGCTATQPLTCYVDSDRDTFGDDEMEPQSLCPADDGSCGDGFSLMAGDCDDAMMSINPDATESCNTVNDDCDMAIDEGTTIGCYVDSDRDGYGTGELVQVCPGRAGFCPVGYAPVAGDCADGEPAVNPGAFEDCNGIDDDCNPDTRDPASRDCSNACGVGTQECRDDAWTECSAPTDGCFLTPAHTGPTSDTGLIEAPETGERSFAQFLVDGADTVVGKLWDSRVGIDRATVTYTFNAGSRTLLEYHIGLAIGTDRNNMPTAWDIYYRDPVTGIWQLLERQSDVRWGDGELLKKFVITVPPVGTAFRIEFLQDGDGTSGISSGLRIGELYFWGY